MIPLLVFFLLMWLLKRPELLPFATPERSASLALGFILVFAFLVGSRIKRLSLPQITGFILAGILCGPDVLNFIRSSDVQNLQLLDGLALSVIALTAGGEMRLERLRARFNSISSVVLFQTVMILSGFILLGVLGRTVLPFLEGRALVQVFAFSLLLGTLCTPTSPATTIAVITESKAAGKFTDLILATAVVKDFLVIVVFAFSLSLSKSVGPASGSFDLGFLVRILTEVGGSILIGGLIGFGIILYLKYIRRDVPIFILGVAFFSYQVFHPFGFHPLLICLVAGFVAENLSAQGKTLIDALERSSMPIYVVFFAISGASLDLDALRQTWFVALACVVWRGVLKFAGTYFGALVAKEERDVRRWSWAGYISQAGVALGMAIVVQHHFPEWGAEFMALVLGIIAINQVVGPVFFQRLLVKQKEVGKKA
ncbi:MAG: cation:proton antiporter [Candidatus Aminicenantales bacterium]